ncbi:MAG TPA: cytochrome c [Steroidobacteraceae bacterium]|nr:cytochrome c [Steroidobacteraceae bacterium]
MKYFIGALAMLVALVVGAVMVSYAGVYNVAATQPHAALTHWFLDNTMEHSVEAHARNIQAPTSFSEEQVRAGAHHFDEMCAGCHGAPGMKDDDESDMLPDPPDLQRAAPHWNAAEQFWIVKHGIKMSAMPSFGKSHSDADIWNIVAFLQQLPKLSAEQYSELVKAPGGESEHVHEEADRHS